MEGRMVTLTTPEGYAAAGYAPEEIGFVTATDAADRKTQAYSERCGVASAARRLRRMPWLDTRAKTK